MEDALASKPPRAAFGKLLACEARLALREPIGMFSGLAIPGVLLVVFGLISSVQKHEPQLGGLTVIAVYVPILIAFSLGMLGFFSLPRALVTYRELGILRRLSTTPLPPSWVLAAQLVINFVLAVWALIVLVVGGPLPSGPPLPRARQDLPWLSCSRSPRCLPWACGSRRLPVPRLLQMPWEPHYSSR